MKYFTVLFIITCFVCFSHAARKTIQVKSDNTPIYKTSSGDASKGSLFKGDQLTLLKKSKDRSLIKTRTGLKGWVKNSSIEYVKGSKGDTYKLGEQEVHGWLDNPSAIYILDESGLSTEALPLNRRFEDEVFEQQDRETIERSNDEN